MAGLNEVPFIVVRFDSPSFIKVLFMMAALELLPPGIRFKTRLYRISLSIRQYFQPSPGYQYCY